MKTLRLFLLFTILFSFACGEKSNVKTGTITNLPTAIPTQFAQQTFSQNGVGIISVVNYQNRDVDQAIEEGISGAIRSYRAVHPEWTQKQNVSEYLVMFIEPQALNQNGTPAILVSGIQSAGTVIGVGLSANLYSPPVIVLPHQSGQNWQYLKYLKFSAWNEAEHYLEYHNDLPLFYTFAVSNDVHPHIPRIYLDGEERE